MLPDVDIQPILVLCQPNTKPLNLNYEAGFCCLIGLVITLVSINRDASRQVTCDDVPDDFVPSNVKETIEVVVLCDAG